MVSSIVKRIRHWANARRVADANVNDQRSFLGRSRLSFEELEPRILYSADPLSASIALMQTDTSIAQVRVVSEEVAAPARELVVIDLRVEGALELANTIAEQGQGKYQLLLVDASTDGLAAVTAQVQTEQQWQAIHLVTHGASGQVQLGSSMIDTALLAQRGDELSAWAERLTESGDFLLYGCDVGAGTAGEAFVQQLAARLQADVAASNDTSGNAALGGDWVLEVQAGAVDASLLSSTTGLETLSGVLALTPQGGEERANLATIGTQTTTYVKRTTAMDSAGNFVVVWQDGTGVDGSGLGVYLRRFDASGNPLSGDIRVNTFTSGDQHLPQIAMNAAGDFIVVWESTGQDIGGAGIYAQRFNANGTTNGSEFRVNQTTILDQSKPAVAIDGAGNFVVTWDAYNQDFLNSIGVYARRYAANGSALSGEVLINSSILNDQYYSSIGMDAAGNYTIAWVSENQDGDISGIFAQRFNNSGVAQGGEFQVNTTSTGSQALPAVAMDGTSIVILWEASTQDAGGYGVYGRRFTAAGVALGSEFQLNSISAGTQENVTVAMTGSGGFLAGWNQTAAISGVYVREYDASGVALSAEVQIDTTGSGFQGNATVATNATGSAVVSWAGEGPGDTDGMFFRRYSYVSNAAPVLNSAQTPVLGSLNEDVNAPSGAVGSLVSSLVDFASPSGQVDNVTDADGSALLGIAVTAANSLNGTWWYTTNGGSSWLALGSVSEGNARLLNADANTRVYYQPNGNTNGVIDNALTFRAWDRTSGSNGGTAVLATTTLDSFSSISYSVNNGTTNWNGDWIETDGTGGGAASGAITLTGTSLHIATESVSHNLYRSVDLSGASGARLTLSYAHIVTGNDAVALQISSDGGSNYTTLETFSAANNGAGTRSYDISAFSSSNARIRFYVSNHDNIGDFFFDDVSIAWNMQTGGATAFSVATDGANLTVNPINDAPILANTPLSITVQEDAGLPVGAVGVLLSTLIGGISDVDMPASPGLAIVASDETFGTWYYTVNSGSTWQTVGAVSNSSSLLLADNTATRLYFAPASNVNGTSGSALTVRAWDQTSGVAGTRVDTSVRGGSTAFSSAIDAIDVTINAVNDPPVLTFGQGNVQFTENQGPLIIDSLVTLTDVDFTTFLGAHLLVDVPVNGQGNEFIRIQNEGMAAGQVGISGSNVFYGGVQIATFSGSGAPMDVTFNASATLAGVEAVMRNVVFVSDSEDTMTLDRTVRFRFVDSGGANSAAITKQITIQTDNDIWVSTTSVVEDGDTSSIFNLMANRGADGRISLAEAIRAANASTNTLGADRIYFDIQEPLVGGAHTIALTSALPAILEAVVIDGTTEPNYVAGSPVIEINGTNAGAGSIGLRLNLGSDGSFVQGLVINGFGDAGIFVGSDNNIIRSNFVGTNVTGMAAIANGGNGIHVQGSGNLIGGALAMDANLISGNTTNGITLAGLGAHSNFIAGNIIGANALQTGTLGNGNAGISLVAGAANNNIGGIGYGNTVVGNIDGIALYDAGTEGNVIVGNYIGVTSALLAGFGNLQEGVQISNGAANNQIGGVNSGEGNTIAYNGVTLYAGISVDSSTGNALLRNSIYGNANLGINLNWGSPAPTLNDVDDLDSGANNLQNFPVLWDAVISGADIRITGHLESAALTTYRIEFFSSPLGTEDPTGYGEGVQFIGALDITTDATGRFNFNHLLNGYTGVSGDRISATATLKLGPSQYSDTSEFSMNVAASAIPAGVSIATTSGFVTSEAGAATSFSFTLTRAPIADVTIALASSDTSEGTLSASSLTFTTANWNVAQVLTVTGVADLWIDGNQPYSVVTGVASSSDPAYNGLNVGDISLSNTDTNTYNTLVVTTAQDVSDGAVSSISALMADMGVDNRISLREAILATNATSNGPGGADRIIFNIADPLVGGEHVISLSAALPFVQQGLLIDASTEPDVASNAGRPVVVLDGNDTAVNGLTITGSADYSSVRGLIIRDFGGQGLLIDTGADYITVAGNYIGNLSSSGASAPAGNENGLNGIAVLGSFNQIGGTAVADRNVISGNFSAGIQLLGGGNNVISGNYIGTDATGMGALANGSGVHLANSATNTIGGTAAGAGNVISGNVGDGIRLEGASTTGNVVQGNLVGTNPLGTGALGNGGNGIALLAGAHANTIGGAVAGARNIVSGNLGSGILVDGSATNLNVIQGNFIGTDSSGTVALANGYNGIRVVAGAQNTTIGGTLVNAGNLISGNVSYGIAVENASTDGTVIQGNYIGVNAAGTAPISNGDWGIVVDFGATNTLIGGSSPLAGNLISGNTNNTGNYGHGGIYVWGSDTTIQGNAIGVDSAGTGIISNGTLFPLFSAGIYVSFGSVRTRIGGVNANESNTIAGNIGPGVVVDNGTTQTTILGNQIYANTGIGIDLAGDGVTLNDTDDVDVGTNDLQNFPVLSYAQSFGGTTNIAGAINSTANTDFRIEFFASPLGDPSGYGQGQVYIGRIDLTTDASGNMPFYATAGLSSIPAGYAVSATATRMSAGIPQATSEFSATIVCDDNFPGITLTPTGASTSEVGGVVTVGVRLDTAPTADVTLTFNVSDASEASLSQTTLTFTSANWNVSQFITVSGLNDSLVDGTIGYFLQMAPASSADPAYSARDIADLALSNADNDVAGILVSPPLIGSEVLLNSTTSGLQQVGFGGVKVSAIDTNGRYAVVWTDVGTPGADGSGNGVYLRVFAADGTALTSDILVNQTTTGNQQSAAVVRLANGDLVVTWEGNGAGDADGIYARRYTGLGVALGAELLVNTTTAGLQSVPSIAADGVGNFVVVWASPDVSGYGVFAQRMAANGTFIGGEFQVNLSSAADERYGDVAMNAAGEFVVVWRGADVDGTAIWARRFDAAGAALGADVKVSDSTGFVEDLYPSVGIADDGSFVVAWSSEGGEDGSGRSALARRFDASGVALGASFFVGSRTQGDQFYSTVGMFANGEFVLSWNDFMSRDGSSFGVYAQRYDAAGATIGSEFRVSTSTTGAPYADQYWSFIATDRIGRMLIVWNGEGAGDTTGVFGQAYNFRAETNEAGATVSYSVVLDAQPSAAVTFGVSVSNVAEASVSASTITFTTANWNVPQIITVTGLQDFINDGDTSYSLVLSAASSADAAFQGIDPTDVALINRTVANISPVIGYAAGPVTVNEDTTHVFSSAGSNAILISDADAGLQLIDLTLGTTNGSLFLSTLSGLTVVAGSNGSASMTVRGSVSSLNAALDGLQRTSTANWNGSTTITVDVNDRGNTGSGGALTASMTIAVTVTPVNDAPVMSGIQALNYYLEDDFNPAGTLVSLLVDTESTDVDAGALQGVAVFQTSDANGLWQYTLDGATWQNFGAVSFSNARLLAADATTAVRFVPNANFHGYAGHLGILAWDQTSGVAGGTADVNFGGGSSSASLASSFTFGNVTPVNDAPTAVSQSRTIDENTSYVFGIGDFGFADPLDSIAPNAFAGLTITALPSQGSLTLAGSAVSVNQTVTSAQLLAGDLVFTPTVNANGAGYANFSFRVQDDGGTANSGVDTQASTSTFQFDVTPVNTAPSLTTNSLTIAEGGTVVLTVANIAVQDFDNTPSQLTLTVTGLSNGRFEYLAAPGVAIATFTQADINAGLVQFVHDGSQVAPAYSLTATDGAFSVGPQAATISYGAVNDAPSVTLPSGAVNEDTSFVWSVGNGNAIVLGDADAGSATVELSLSASAGGTLTLASLSGISIQSGANGSGAMVIRGSLANLTFALDGLALLPATNFNGNVTLTALLDDLGNSGSGGARTDTAIATVNVSPVNDAPLFTGGSVLNNYLEDDLSNSGTLVSSLIAAQMTDVDAGDPQGVVVFSADTTNGRWEFTLDGSTWQDFGTVSSASGRLLAADATTAVRFVPNANYHGTTGSLGLRGWDQSSGTAGATANASVVGGGTAFSSTSVLLPAAVFSVSDAPTGADQSRVINESTAFVFNATDFGFADPNDAIAPNVLASITITALPSAGNLSFQGSAVTLNQVITAAQLSAGDLVFTPVTHANGVAYSVFGFRVTDTGSAANGGVTTQAGGHTFNFDVTPVNTAPVLAVNQLTISEGATVVLTNAHIQVQDFDNNAASLSIAVSALLHGQFELLANPGVAINAFTQADIDAGLVQFVHDNSQLAPSYQLTASDGPLTTGPQAASITYAALNNAPVLAYAGGLATSSEDGFVVFSSANANALVLSDADAGLAVVQLALSSSNGFLSLASVTGIAFVSGSNGTPAMVLQGSINDLNAALEGLTFWANSNFNGAASISATVNDLGNSGAGGALTDSQTISIAIAAVNDAPTISVPAAQAVNEDTSLVLSGANRIQIADVDAAAGMVHVQLSVSSGALTLSQLNGLTLLLGDGTLDSIMLIRGTVADVNLALDGLRFDPASDFAGSVTLSVSVDDLGNTGGAALQGSAALAISVLAQNDAPVNSMPLNQTVAEDTLLVLDGANRIQVFDQEAALMRLTLSVDSGTLTLPSLSGVVLISGSGSNDSLVEIEGSPASLNAVLDGLRFQPQGNFVGTVTLTVVSDDLGSSGAPGPLSTTTTLQIAVTAVNDAPVNVVPGPQSVNEDAVLVLAGANALQIQDVDAASAMVQVTVSVSSGSLTLAGLSGLTFLVGDGLADSSFVVQGSVSAINTALDGLSYMPDANYFGAVTLSLLTDDLGNTGGGSLQALSTVAITVNSINDAPTHQVPLAPSVQEDSLLVFTGANVIQISDVDLAGGPIRVQLNVSSGVLSLSGIGGLSFVSGSGFNDASMVFEGSLAAVNAALDGLRFQANAHFNGSVTLTLLSDDLGGSGAPGALTASSSVTIAVLPVNDAPTQSVPGPQVVSEDTALVFTGGNRLQVADLDAGGASMRVTLSVANGTLSLASSAGLSFAAGDGWMDGFVQFTGSVADINAALDGLTYLPNAHMNGSDQLSITTEDLGNSGAGGNLMRSDVVDIAIAPVNDPVTVTTPSVIQIPEDTLAFVRESNGQAFVLQDVDASGYPMQILITSSMGHLRLSTLTGITVLDGDPAGSSALTLRAEISDLNAALRTLQLLPAPDYFGTVRISVSVDDLGGQPGSGASATALSHVDVMVTGVNDPPEVSLASAFFSVQQVDVGQAVSGAVSIRDVDNAFMTSATVSIVSGFEAGKDRLYLETSLLDAQTQSALSASWNAATGTLTLSGSATSSQYASAMAAVRFATNSVSAGVKEIGFSVGDGAATAVQAKSVGSIQFAVVVTPPTTPVTPVVVTNENGAPTSSPSGDTGSSATSTPLTASAPASAETLAQQEAQVDLAERERRSVRLKLAQAGSDPSASARAARVELKSEAGGGSVFGQEQRLALELSGPLGFNEVNGAQFKNLNGLRVGGSRALERLSDREEQGMAEDIARESRASDMHDFEISAAQATTAGAAAFATLLLWTIRAGGIVAAIASSAPAWGNIDPLPLLLDETGGTAEEPDWGDTQAETLAAVAGSTMMEAQVVLNRA